MTNAGSANGRTRRSSSRSGAVVITPFLPVSQVHQIDAADRAEQEPDDGEDAFGPDHPVDQVADQSPREDSSEEGAGDRPPDAHARPCVVSLRPGHRRGEYIRGLVRTSKPRRRVSAGQRPYFAAGPPACESFHEVRERWPGCRQARRRWAITLAIAARIPAPNRIVAITFTCGGSPIR